MPNGCAALAYPNGPFENNLEQTPQWSGTHGAVKQKFSLLMRSKAETFVEERDKLTKGTNTYNREVHALAIQHEVP